MGCKRIAGSDRSVYMFIHSIAHSSGVQHGQHRDSVAVSLERKREKKQTIA